MTDVSREGQGFSWVPPIRAGTIFSITGGDSRGMGTAGSTVRIVQYDEDSSCLDGTSPSSTVGKPAGWINPTAHMLSATKGDESGRFVVLNELLPTADVFRTRSIIAVIAAVTVGSLLVVALAMLVLSIWRRRKMRSRPRVLIDEIDDDLDQSNRLRRNQSRNNLPENHHLEPFPLLQAVQEKDVHSPQESESGIQRYPRRPSEASSLTSKSRLSVNTSFSGRKYEALGYTKGAMFEQESPVSILQHGDAGPSRSPESPESPIELPPAYARIKRASQLLWLR